MGLILMKFPCDSGKRRDKGPALFREVLRRDLDPELLKNVGIHVVVPVIAHGVQGLRLLIHRDVKTQPPQPLCGRQSADPGACNGNFH